jgi:hypothetical protein
MPRANHCWHPTGASSSLGTGAPVSADVFCCFCDARDTVPWSITWEPVGGGHGPKLRHAVHHYHTKAAPCPKRGAVRTLRRQGARND